MNRFQITAISSQFQNKSLIWKAFPQQHLWRLLTLILNKSQKYGAHHRHLPYYRIERSIFPMQSTVMSDTPRSRPIIQGSLTDAFDAVRCGQFARFIRALQALVRPRAQRAARRMKSCLAGTDDLIQQASRRASRKQLPWFETKEHLRNFIYKGLRWAILDAHRRDHGRKASAPTADAPAGSEKVPKTSRPTVQRLFDTDRLRASVPDFSTMDRIALKEALMLLEAHLPDAFRVIQCRYDLEHLQKRSLREASDQLGLPVSKIRQYERLALLFLQEKLN